MTNAKGVLKIVVTMIENGLYIEEVTENLDVNGYEVECEESDMLEWYGREYGFVEEDNDGSTYRVSNEEVLEYMKYEPKRMNEFALSLRDKWVICEE